MPEGQDTLMWLARGPLLASVTANRCWLVACYAVQGLQKVGLFAEKNGKIMVI